MAASGCYFDREDKKIHINRSINEKTNIRDN
jgi:hypothetical protein